MLLSKKNPLLIAIVIFYLSPAIIAQSFSWYGGTNLTINYGQNTASATYYFTYNFPNKLCYAGLIIAVDGSVINNDLCNNPSTPSSYTINFTEGTHTVKFSLLSVNCKTLNCRDLLIHQVEEFTVNVNFQIRNENIFNYGVIYVNDYSTQKNSPYDRTSNPNDNYLIGAIDQSYGGYNWIWNNSGINNSKWIRRKSGMIDYDHSYDRYTNYTVQSDDKNTILIAGLRKICNITFQNNFIGVGNGGVITVNGSQYNSPTSSFQVVEQNPITAEANTYYYNNGIIYTFKQWNDGNTSYNRTFNPTEHTTYTAQFQGKPANELVSFGNAVGEPIVINWTDNPNPNVTQYQIWRIVKHNGITGPATQIATVSRGVQTYTDYDYILTSSYTHDLLQYDVRAYYSTEGTYSDPDYEAVYGQNINIKDEKNIASLEKEIPKEFSISNYPNPFNPTTKIKYELPKDGFISIKIYDALGKEITTLVNDYKKAGIYTTEFRAQSSELS
ncbi:MAG: hypothetical protein ACOYU5_01280, partial [Stygiobacter sp.]